MKEWPHLFGKVSSFPEMESEFQEAWKVCTSIFETCQNMQSILFKNYGDLCVDDENDWVTSKLSHTNHNTQE